MAGGCAVSSLDANQVLNAGSHSKLADLTRGGCRRRIAGAHCSSPRIDHSSVLPGDLPSRERAKMDRPWVGAGWIADECRPGGRLKL